MVEASFVNIYHMGWGREGGGVRKNRGSHGFQRGTDRGMDHVKASLKDYCKKKGFKAYSVSDYGISSHSKARIGFLGDDYANCRASDSRIGFGTVGSQHPYYYS